jgi:hypothetical protein
MGRGGICIRGICIQGYVSKDMYPGDRDGENGDIYLYNMICIRGIGSGRICIHII